MKYLISITILWAFSFSLIGVYLAGQVDAWFCVLTRITLAGLLFLPFLKIDELTLKLSLKLMLIGAVQLGFMYCFYYQSFLYLSVPEVLLFTVFTPIYVTIFYDLIHGNFSPWYLLTAFISVIGAILIKYNGIDPNFIFGFFVVQGANLCFALGQVAYKSIMEKEDKKSDPLSVFALFYIGAFIVALPMFLIFGNIEKLPTTNLQWEILIYLGLVASGLGYYFWNKGATQVNSGLLAIMNNALVPAGLVVNILIWNKDTDLLRLSLGGAIILFSLYFNETWVKKRIANSNSKLSNKLK